MANKDKKIGVTSDGFYNMFISVEAGYEYQRMRTRRAPTIQFLQKAMVDINNNSSLTLSLAVFNDGWNKNLFEIKNNNTIIALCRSNTEIAMYIQGIQLGLTTR